MSNWNHTKKVWIRKMNGRWTIDILGVIPLLTFVDFDEAIRFVNDGLKL